MIMIFFGALSAGTKTYLLCRSDRQAFTSAFCNTLRVDCLKFCFSLEIRSSIWPLTISFQDDRTESSTISRLVNCNAYWSTASHKSDLMFFKSLEETLLRVGGGRLGAKPWHIKSPVINYGAFCSVRCKIYPNSQMGNLKGWKV